jgi:UrcA family protein
MKENKMNMSRISAAALAVAMTTAILPEVARAETPTTVVEARIQPTKLVSYADLNLSRASDLATLQTRVRRAANSLCLPNGKVDLLTISDGMTCRNAAIADANRQIEIAIANAGNTQFAQAQSYAIKVALR